MKKNVFIAYCIALFFSLTINAKGYAESAIIVNGSMCSFDNVFSNQIKPNVNSGTITMVSDDGIFSFYLDELIKIYRKKDISYACDFFTSKGFKNKNGNEDNIITITYDGKIIKIVVKMKEEMNPFPFEWSSFLDDEGFKLQETKIGKSYRLDYRKIGFPIISQYLDFSKYPYLGYFYIGAPVPVNK